MDQLDIDSVLRMEVYLKVRPSNVELVERRENAVRQLNQLPVAMGPIFAVGDHRRAQQNFIVATQIPTMCVDAAQ